MVYISTSALNWLPLIQGWLMSRTKTEADQLLKLFSSSFPTVYEYACRHLNFKMDILEALVVRQACDILTGLIPAKGEKDYAQVRKLIVEVYDKWMYFRVTLTI